MYLHKSAHCTTVPRSTACLSEYGPLLCSFEYYSILAQVIIDYCFIAMLTQLAIISTFIEPCQSTGEEEADQSRLLLSATLIITWHLRQELVDYFQSCGMSEATCGLLHASVECVRETNLLLRDASQCRHFQCRQEEFIKPAVVEIPCN